MRPLSIKDVAHASGVSIATVSRVINENPSVKEDNRKKVLEVVKKLNFKPSLVARRLAKRKLLDVIALVIPRYEGVFYSFYVLELIRGIGTLCEALKLDLLLHLTDSKSSLNLSGIGGIIFADIIGNMHQLSDALRLEIPTVVINHTLEDKRASCISIDNKGGAAQAVDYLVALGHRRIAHIAGDLVTQAAQLRLEGYRIALEKNKLPYIEDYVIKTDYSRAQARQAAKELLKLKSPPTAIFVASDSMALELISVATELNKEIPRDFSVIGFDDNPMGLYAPVALTTVRQPLVKMAQESVKFLNNLMRAQIKKNIKLVLPCELVIRQSCSSISKS